MHLEENNITVIHNNDRGVGNTVNAFGEDAGLILGQHSSMNYESIPLKA